MGFRKAVIGSCGLLWLLAVAPVAGEDVKSVAGPRYDPNSVVEILATVVDVQEEPQTSPMSGVCLTVKAKSETLRAYLGPAEFLEEIEVTFAKGDRVHVVGSKVKWGGSQIVLAREIRKESTTVYLRDQQGKPYWPAEGKGGA